MKGITIAEECHVILGIGAVDVGGVAKVSTAWSMEDYQHASIIITTGAVTDTTTFTVFNATTQACGTEAAIGFDYYAETTAAGDTLGSRTTVENTGFASGTNNSTTFVIEVDASELTAGYNWMRVKSDAAAASMINVVVILSGARYASTAARTAIM